MHCESSTCVTGLDPPFTLRFMLPGSFANLYDGTAARKTVVTVGLADRLTDFEKAFEPLCSHARMTLTSDTASIWQSNYVEGLASVTSGIPATGNTLGALVKVPHRLASRQGP